MAGQRAFDVKWSDLETEYLTTVNEYRPQLTIKRHWKVQLTINIIIWSIS